MTTDSYIEALLFWKGEPISVSELALILEKSEEEIRAALAVLETKLAGRGVALMYKENEVMLGTNKDAGSLIEKLVREELSKDLGKAGLETLSIVLYRGPVSRRDIDYIRGVNSQHILRNLLIRGLIEKVPHPQDQRSFVYKPTFELLAHLGVTRVEDMPEYTEVKKELESHQGSEENEQPPHESAT